MKASHIPGATFQHALIHLCANIDRFDSYSDELFDGYALTEAERADLRELMEGQRDGLVAFNGLLRHKRTRTIREALPYSRRLVPGQLDALLLGFAERPVPEGAVDAEQAVKSFAAYVGAELASRRDTSRAAELVWFETRCASITTSAALLQCRFDVLAALHDPTLLGADESEGGTRWFVAIPTPGHLRVLAVGSGLAAVIERLRAGCGMEQAITSVPDGEQRTAVARSIQRMSEMGARWAPTEENTRR